jgi:ribose transport system substrate-binding protein
MQRTRYVGPSLGAVLLAAGVAAFAGTANAADLKLPANCSTAKPTIGVALPNTVNPYYIAMQASFKTHGAELGYNVNVAIANDSDSNQLAQVEAFIQQGVCAVALNAVNSGPGAASVRALNQAGIPVFTVNVIVSGDDLKAQHAAFVEYVGADQVAGGTQMGEQALKDLGANAKMVVGIIGDPDQIPTNQRDGGFKAAISKDANAKVVETLNGKVDPNVSMQITGDMLQGHPDINVLWADTGPHAVGALQAINQQGKADSIKLYAFCAADTALTPTYAACAAQQPAEYAAILLDNLKKYLGGAEVPAEVLRPLKIFINGQKPGPGEVG